MIYLDHHSTTPMDKRVVEAMLPWLTTGFANPHSDHVMGRQAADAIEQSLDEVAGQLGVGADHLVVTSGATEANCLAISGFCNHPRQKRKHVVSVATEHPAVLDVLMDLKRDGVRSTIVPVIPNGSEQAGSEMAGLVDLDQLAEAITDETGLVSVMWANNEIGSIAPMRQIADLCHQRGALLHCDATQAIGRIPTNVREADIDLLSLSAHKFYGPKGIGLLVVGNGNRRVRLRPQMVGGGQQRSLRGGTLPTAMIVAMAKAMQMGVHELIAENKRISGMRNLLWQRISESIDGVQLNGPAIDSPNRLPGNLNFSVPGVEGETWMTATPEIAFSTGSACSSADPTPSHVVLAVTGSESLARQSVRFGVGRGNTEIEISRAADLLIESYRRLMGT